jgi:ADP-ribose pyrophosphatase
VEPRATERVFDGAIFHVFREDWPQARHPIDVVRHPGAAGVLPVTPAGDALLVRQLRPAIRQRLMEIPAGLLDRPGEDAISCATRELLEETGYRHRWIEFLGGIYTTAGFSDEYVHLFWAGTEPQPAQAPEEGIEVLIMPLHEMVAAARAGRVPDAKTALALLMADGKPSRGWERVG